MKPYAIVRREEKGHGKSGLVIGSVRDRSVLLVEDVTTSGGSALFGIEALQSAGARVEMVVAVVDREQGAAETLRKHGIRLASLVSAKELLEARED
jgi:orotate phosphoribosyltransferase